MNIGFLTPNMVQSNPLKVQNTGKFRQSPVTPAFCGNDKYEFSKPALDTDASKEDYADSLKKQLAIITETIDSYYSGKLYKEKLQNHPSVAFLYNPDLTCAERTALLNESESVFSRTGLANKMGLHQEKITAWIENGNFEAEIISRLISGRTNIYHIDTEFPKNKTFIEYVESVLPHSIPGEELLVKYNFSQDEFRNLVKSGKLKPVGFDSIPEKTCGPYNLLFDMEDDVNKLTIQRHLRITPLPSSKYGKRRKQLVPVSYLQKLGYGDTKKLAKMVQKGYLPGKFEEVPKEGEKKKYRVYVDISGYIACVEKLIDLRKENPDVVTVKKLASELRMTQQSIKDAIIDGELDIIPEYIFPEDSGTLIDKTTEKNSEFINQRLFELRLIQEQKEADKAEAKRLRAQKVKNPMQSLYMELVWSMCPGTKAVASIKARQDGLASKIIAKKAKGEEELTRSEEMKYRSYCNSFWAASGKEEFHEAHQKAKAIIEQYKKGGLDAVNDPDARKVIEEFLNGTNS